jgi:hypothetical protein
VVAGGSSFVRYRPSSERDANDPTVNATTRIVVLLLSFAFAAGAVATAFTRHLALAMCFGVPAFVFFAIALSGGPKSGHGAKDAGEDTPLS